MRYSLPVAYLLWLFSGCGALGLHRFYLGKVGTGVLWVFTGGLAMVGSIYDLLTMRRQVEDANALALYRARLLTGEDDASGRGRGARIEARESIERTILRTAKRNKGEVTPGEVALDGDCTLDDAKKTLEKMAASGTIEMRVRSSGVVVYVFPEFAPGGNDYIA